MGLFASKGVKRYISTILGSILVLLSGLPILGPMVAIPVVVNGALGAVGVLQGALANTILDHLPATAGAVLSVLYAACEYVPALQPYAPIVKWLLTAVGGVTLAKGVGTQIVATK